MNKDENMPLENLVTFISGGTPSKQNPSNWGDNPPWVSAKDLKSLKIEKSIDTLSDEGRTRAAIVPAGTLLLLVRGMSLFKGIPLGIAMRGLAINQDIKGLVPNKKVSSFYLAYSLLAHEDKLLNYVEAAGHGTGRLDTDTLKGFQIRVPNKNEARVHSDYFLHWLSSHEARQRIKNSAQGSVRETVSFSEFATIHFPLPDAKRQSVIAAYLNCLRDEIALLQRQSDKLRLQKRGLMQKLLTGEWQVKSDLTPEASP
jgi:type I restriction enzyme S subunit